MRMTSLTLALTLLLASLASHGSCQLSCAGFWEDVKHDILRPGNQQVFESAIAPFTEFTKVTYTWRLDTVIPGWQRVHNTSVECGMHAVTYRKISHPKIAVIAIRGTQLGESRESWCDLCANAFISGNISRYKVCKQFPESSINYFQQAKIYTENVMSEFGVTCLGFTGHSLGAVLSQLLSAHYSARHPAIVFASSGPKGPAHRFGLKPRFENLISLYSEYDPIVVLPVPWTNQSGIGCKFEDGPLPDYCAECYEHPSLDLTNLTTPCGLCFIDKHIYKHYLDMIFVDKKVPTCSAFESKSYYYTFFSSGSTSRQFNNIGCYAIFYWSLVLLFVAYFVDI